MLLLPSNGREEEVLKGLPRIHSWLLGNASPQRSLLQRTRPTFSRSGALQNAAEPNQFRCHFLAARSERDSGRRCKDFGCEEHPSPARNGSGATQTIGQDFMPRVALV